jgi:hypothetical protein
MTPDPVDVVILSGARNPYGRERTLMAIRMFRLAQHDKFGLMRQLRQSRRWMKGGIRFPARRGNSIPERHASA